MSLYALLPLGALFLICSNFITLSSQANENILPSAFEELAEISLKEITPDTEKIKDNISDFLDDENILDYHPLILGKTLKECESLFGKDHKHSSLGPQYSVREDWIFDDARQHKLTLFFQKKKCVAFAITPHNKKLKYEAVFPIACAYLNEALSGETIKENKEFKFLEITAMNPTSPKVYTARWNKEKHYLEIGPMIHDGSTVRPKKQSNVTPEGRTTEWDNSKESRFE